MLHNYTLQGRNWKDPNNSSLNETEKEKEWNKSKYEPFHPYQLCLSTFVLVPQGRDHKQMQEHFSKAAEERAGNAMVEGISEVLMLEIPF